MSVRRRYLKCNFLKTISIIFLPVYFHIVDIIGKTQYNEHIIKYEFVELSRQRAENPFEHGNKESLP